MKPMTKKEQAAQDRIDDLAALREILKPGDTVYAVLQHVSKSGMMRHIDFYAIHGGEMRMLSGYIGRLLDYSRPKGKDGLKVSGCGMDMAFSVVYNLGRVLFPDGFKVEGTGRNGDTSGTDKDGGYALRSKWL